MLSKCFYWMEHLWSKIDPNPLFSPFLNPENYAHPHTFYFSSPTVLNFAKFACSPWLNCAWSCSHLWCFKQKKSVISSLYLYYLSIHIHTPTLHHITIQIFPKPFKSISWHFILRNFSMYLLRTKNILQNQNTNFPPRKVMLYSV